MIPMPEDAEVTSPMPEKQQSDRFHGFLDQKSETDSQNIQLCSTPPLSVTNQQFQRKRNNISPTHFSKKERILQSLISSAAAGLLPDTNEKNQSQLSRKRSVENAFQRSELEDNQTEKKRICVDPQETPAFKLKGTLTWMLVGENGNVLWKESAKKEKIVSC